MLKLISAKNITESKMEDFYDIVICFGGFEERVLGILNVLENKKMRFLSIIKYSQQSEEVNKLNNKNYLVLKEYLSPKAEEVFEISNNPDKPISTIEQIQKEVISKIKKKKISILLDISGCNNSLIHNLVYMLDIEKKRNKKAFRVDIIYTKPKHYFVFNVENTEYDNFDMPYVRFVHPVSNFLGTPDPLKRECLFLFIGYERFRSESLIQHYLPVKTIFLLNHKSKEESQKDAIQTSIDLHRDIFDDNSTIEQIDFYSFSKIVKKLKSLTKKYSRNYNLIIGCFGSKVQTIAASLIALKNRSITIANARPDDYSPRNYSTGIGKKFILQISI